MRASKLRGLVEHSGVDPLTAPQLRDGGFEEVEIVDIERRYHAQICIDDDQGEFLPVQAVIQPRTSSKIGPDGHLANLCLATPMVSREDYG